MVTVLCITFFVIRLISSVREMDDRTVPMSTIDLPGKNLYHECGELITGDFL